MDASPYAISARYLLDAKYYSLASCVMLFYDMILTFEDEVNKIWSQRFTSVTVLWFMNRYLTPFGYIIVIISWHDPSWSTSTCDRYVMFPEILKIFTATTVGIIFILRLYAVYQRSRAVLIGFSALLATELSLKIWSFTGGIRLQLPPGLVGCILAGRTGSSVLFTFQTCETLTRFSILAPPSNRLMFTWVAELAFDTCVFLAMAYRTMDIYRRIPVTARSNSITEVLLRDGVMYFGVIFVANLVTVMMYLFATPGLKVINASFGTLITTLMVSRLILNLRLSAFRYDTDTIGPPHLPRHAHKREPYLARPSPGIPMSTFRVTHSMEDGSITHDDVKELEHT